MVSDLVKRRLDTYNEVNEVQNIPKPEALFEEIESVTSQPDEKIETNNPMTDRTTKET